MLAGYESQFLALRVPEWAAKYLNLSRLEELLLEAFYDKSDGRKASLSPTAFSLEAMGANDDKAQRFWEQMENEAEGVSEFFQLQLDNVVQRRATVTVAVQNSHLMQSKRQKRMLKQVLQEYHRMLRLLEAYAKLNAEAIKKLCRQYDDLMGSVDGEIFMSRLRSDYEFAAGRRLRQLIHGLEQWWAALYTNGNRLEARQDMRVNYRDSFGRFSYIWIGIFFGVLIPETLLCVSILSSTSDLTSALPNWDAIYHVYRGATLISLFLIMLAVDVAIWQHYQVNWSFIFSFAHQRHLRSRHYLQTGLFFLMAVVTSLLLYLMQARHYFVLGMRPEVWALILMCFLFVYLVMPLKLWHRTSRLWFLKILGRIAAAPFFFVNFEDFWLADQLTSTVLILYDVQYSICFFSVDMWSGAEEKWCDVNSVYFRPALALLPSWWRFAQCIRRYYDSKKKWNLVNAGKYFSSMLIVAMNTLHRFLEPADQFDTWPPLRIAWLVIVICGTCYSLTWDIFMDFSLGRPKHNFLRRRLLYPRKFVYYLAIVVDTVLRFFWIFTISPLRFGPNAFIILFAVGVGEIVRRTHWNIYRLENEHVNNVGEYRAVREMPLPITSDTRLRSGWNINFDDVHDMQEVIDGSSATEDDSDDTTTHSEDGKRSFNGPDDNNSEALQYLFPNLRRINSVSSSVESARSNQDATMTEASGDEAVSGLM